MAPTPRRIIDYRASLLDFFEEEVVGEAFFNTLAERFGTSDQRHKLSLLAQMERRVVETMRPLIEKYDLRPRADEPLHGIGRKEAERYISATWHEFMARIVAEFPVFLEEFSALAAVAPVEDLSSLQAFDRHEIATIEFAKREIAGDPVSAATLVAFLEGSPT